MACPDQASAEGGQGRPMALMVLFGLSLLNLCSEWPSDIARPAYVNALNEALRTTFKRPGNFCSTSINGASRAFRPLSP